MNQLNHYTASLFNVNTLGNTCSRTITVISTLKRFSLLVHLRQLASSDLSLQSTSPSHFQLRWIHSPLLHRNSPAEQWGFWGSVLRLQRSRDSSDLSLQSGSPSQLHGAGIHSELLQRNSCGPQVLAVAAVHFASSLPSPQSSSPSQTNVGATHRRLRHWNSLAGQALASGKKKSVLQ